MYAIQLKTYENYKVVSQEIIGLTDNVKWKNIIKEVGIEAPKRKIYNFKDTNESQNDIDNDELVRTCVGGDMLILECTVNVVCGKNQRVTNTTLKIVKKYSLIRMNVPDKLNPVVLTEIAYLRGKVLILGPRDDDTEKIVIKIQNGSKINFAVGNKYPMDNSDENMFMNARNATLESAVVPGPHILKNINHVVMCKDIPDTVVKKIWQSCVSSRISFYEDFEHVYSRAFTDKGYYIFTDLN